MTEWEIQKLEDDSIYVLKNITQNTITWFQKVKIDKSSIRFYDRNVLVGYLSKKILSKDIIDELNRLPTQEK